MRSARFIAFAALIVCVSQMHARTVEFSGYQWDVRPTGVGGPGPNNWDENNVSVDSNGYLHLTLTQRDGQWYCAEVNTQAKLGFGLYKFTVSGRVDTLDPNVVLGLFNYPTPDIGPDGTNEIDIEFAHWGDPLSPIDNFTVFPAVVDVSPTTKNFPFKLSGTGNSSHTFNWTSTSILFQSFRGTSSRPSASWLFRPRDSQSRIPQNAEPVHMNLWLFQGQAPLNGQPVELIIRSFTFTPL